MYSCSLLLELPNPPLPHSEVTRERKSISARVGSKVQVSQDKRENWGKGQCGGLSYHDLARDLEKKRDGWALAQNRSPWVLTSALHLSPWEDQNTHLFLWPAISATPWLQKVEVSAESAVREGFASIFNVVMWLQGEKKRNFLLDPTEQFVVKGPCPV